MSEGPWDDVANTSKAPSAGPWDDIDKPKEKGLYEKVYGHPFNWREDVFGGFKPEDTSGAGVGGYTKAAAAAAAGIPASLLDAYRQFAYGDKSNLITNRVQQDIMGIGGEATPGAQAALRNINTPLGAIDPYMAMPGSIPTARLPAELKGVKGEKAPESFGEVPPKVPTSSAGPWEDAAKAHEDMKVEGDFWRQHAQQEELPLASSVEDVAAAQNARGNQMDMFLPDQARTTEPWKPLVGDQAELPLENSVQQVAEHGSEPVGQMDMFGAENPVSTDPMREIPAIQPQVDMRRAMDAQEASMDQQAAAQRQGQWTTDENGIPIRTDIEPPMTTPDYANRYMRQDEGARNDLGNAIQEANGPKLGSEDHWGSEPIQTSSPEFNSVMNGLGNSQRGSTDFFGAVQGLVKVIKATRALLDRATSRLSDKINSPLAKIVGKLPEDHMAALPGMSDLIFKPEDGTTWVQKALAEGINKINFPKNWQSGAIMAGEKFKSAALQGVGQWLNWLNKRMDYDIRTTVKPIEKQFSHLPRQEFEDLHKVFISEMFNRQRLSETELQSKLTPKQLQAYKALRGALDQAYERANTTRAKLGLDPISREEAYGASMRRGDWKQSFYDKNGRLVYHVASTNRIAAGKAVAWLKKNVPGIDWEKSGAPKYAPELTGVGAPRDVLSGYHEMLKWFDPTSKEAQAIADAIHNYNDEHGFSLGGHSQRFLEKANVPGFEGNKPWLSDKENATYFFESQMGYLKDSSHWNNAQEALVHLNEIVKNPELAQKQPNIMDYAKKLVAREMGVSPNIFKQVESELAKVLGVSRTTLYHRVSDLKAGTYLQMIGGSIGYMIATPLQGMLSVAMHRYLTTQGNSHNVMKTIVKTAADTSAALMRHYLHEMTGKDIAIPMSDIGKRALMYAEDNGIVSKNITDEYQHLGSSRMMGAIKGVLNPTIQGPEKVGRLSVFMSMVHHLSDARSGLSEKEIFQKAEDFTNHSMTDMSSPARPMIVDKMGAAGELGYVFHSYLFNAAHQMSLFAREGLRGNVSPLLAYLGASMFLGGATALPLVNELDGIWNLFKEGIAKAKPEWYRHVSGLGIKGSIISHLPNWAANGTVSQVTGAAMSSRFAPQFIDPERPLSGLAAPIQEGKEQQATLHAALDPTKRNFMEAAWVNSPPLLKGWLETHSDIFKNKPEEVGFPKETNKTAYRSPSRLNDISTDYKRTPQEEQYRSLGLYANSEYNQKQLRYINSAEQKRVMEAFQNSFEKMQTAVYDHDKERAKKFANSALRLIPDKEALEKMLNESVSKYGMTPEERDATHADVMETLMKIKRIKDATNH
jgi:hypothetical protein